MLFKKHILAGIESGHISLAFRKWKKAAVKSGSRLKTPIGLVEITDIREISAAGITESEARKAGFESRQRALAALAGVEQGQIYRIALCYHAPDPRIALREQTVLSEAELVELQHGLERLDRFSRQGPWVWQILQAIRDNPQLRAAELAAKTGREKDWLKTNIRKLKNLGLTISHHPGYTISPRGAELLLKSGFDTGM